MKLHKKSASTPIIRPKEFLINKIIDQCDEAKKQISHSVLAINKQFSSQRLGWKTMDGFLKPQSSHKNSNLSVSQEIHQKLKKMYDSQIDAKARRLLKFIMYSKNQTITENDLQKQETSKFLLVNKREFGSPLKEISYFPKKNLKNSKNIGSVNPEETILMDIQAYKMKKSISSNNFKRKQVIKDKQKGEGPCKKVDWKNKIVYRELKKISPIINCSFCFGVKNESEKNASDTLSLSSSTIMIKGNKILV